MPAIAWILIGVALGVLGALIGVVFWALSGWHRS
jgi:hypothetical protein